MNKQNLEVGGPEEKGLEHISALADGQLRGEAFAQAVSAAVHDPAARAAWHAYHTVGDVLRFGESAGSGADDGFADRFVQRLARETGSGHGPGAVYAIGLIAKKVHATRGNGQNSREEAANNPVFRWKMVAALATVVAFGAVGWSALGPALSRGGAQQQAIALSAPLESGAGQAAQAVDASDPAAVVQRDRRQMIRDPRLDELLAAHEQVGGVSALSMPAGFLRNATFDGRSR